MGGVTETWAGTSVSGSESERRESCDHCKRTQFPEKLVIEMLVLESGTLANFRQLGRAGRLGRIDCFSIFENSIYAPENPAVFFCQLDKKNIQLDKIFCPGQNVLSLGQNKSTKWIKWTK